MVGFSLELNTFQYSCSSLESAFVFQSFTPMGVFIDGCVYYVFVCLVCLCVDTHTHTKHTHTHMYTHTQRCRRSRSFNDKTPRKRWRASMLVSTANNLCVNVCARVASACVLAVRACAGALTHSPARPRAGGPEICTCP